MPKIDWVETWILPQKEHPRLIQIELLKFERDWRKGKSMVGLYKLLKHESLVWIGGTPVPQTIQAHLNYSFSKVNYVFAFNPNSTKI